MKTHYHTNIRLAYTLGILDSSLIVQIPYSTRQYWRDKGVDDIFGLDYVLDPDSRLAVLRVVAGEQGLYRMVKALTYVFLLYRDMLSGVNNGKLILLQQKKEVLACIEKIVPLVGKRRAFYAFGLSPQRYYYWKRSVACVQKPWGLCRRFFYNQLSATEVKAVCSYLADPAFLHWPLVSVYYRMLRDRAAMMSKATFYLYAKGLGMDVPHRRQKPKYRKKGLRASRVFEYLHVDITEVGINDFQKLYVSFIVDNFSRAVLGWKASMHKGASLTLDNLKGAMQKYGLTHFSILSDDGTENKGVFAGFTDGRLPDIRRLVARIDIPFSNSLLESVNRVFKMFYWPRDFKGSLDQALGIIEAFVHDYNRLRPHGSLGGLTPSEVLHGVQDGQVLPLNEMREAVTRRIAENRNRVCNECINP